LRTTVFWDAPNITTYLEIIAVCSTYLSKFHKEVHTYIPNVHMYLYERVLK
jgi:hypothetical protein